MSKEDLRADYKRGLIVAISFCVFVMPILLGAKPDEKEQLKLMHDLNREPADPKSSLEEVKSDDEVDGRVVKKLPKWAQRRLLDGVQETLEI